MNTEMIVAESRELHQLTTQMQRHVDRTLAADRKGGEALWEKALAVADARAEAKHGDWQAYLGATGMEERSARRLIGIADRGRSEGRFREAIISGWLSFSVAAIAAKADDDLLTGLLDQPTPPTRAQLMASANPALVPDLKPARPATPPAHQIEKTPDVPADLPGWTWFHRGVDWQLKAPDGWHTNWYFKPERAEAEARRRMLRPKAANIAPARPATPTEASRLVAYAAEIAGIYRQRIAATETTAELEAIRKEIDADMRLSPSGVSDLAAQISLRLTAAPFTALAAQPPAIAPASPLDAVSEALRKNDTKAAYAAVHLISNDLDRTRAYAAVDARIDGKSLGIVLAMLEQPTTPALSAFPPGHVEAGIGAIERRLQSGSQISTDAPWAEKLRIQLDAARETMQPAVYETWSARIGAVQAALVKAAVNAAIEAPQAAPVATPNTKKPRLILLQHAEDVLAGLIERSSPVELRLIYALFISTRSSNVSDDLWNYGRNRLDVMNKELEWIVGDDGVKSIPG